jgi:hypothetical protein
MSVWLMALYGIGDMDMEFGEHAKSVVIVKVRGISIKCS